MLPSCASWWYPTYASRVAVILAIPTPFTAPPLRAATADRRAIGDNVIEAVTGCHPLTHQNASAATILNAKEFNMTAALDPGRPFTGNERELLENTLELNRDELVRAVEHLSDSQARRKLVPSLTTPLSLIKHCAAAERIWFQRTLAGMAAEDCDGYAETGGDPSFHVGDDETLGEVLAEYAAARKRSNEIAARYALDDKAEHRLVGTVSLRFILLGMIAELARHAGHADILAEQIRASTIDVHP